MRKAKSVEVIDHKPEIFLRYFGMLLQQIESNENIEMVLKSLTRIEDSIWRAELVDPQNPSRCITLLHAMVLAIIFLSPNNEIKVLFLSQLIDLTSYDLWNIRPPRSDSSGPNVAIFNVTPRECLFELCQQENGNKFYVLLRNLMTNMPLEMAAQHGVHYIEFCTRVVLKEKENITLDMSSLLASISEHGLIDAELWFKPIGESSEPAKSLISILMGKLSALIQLFEKHFFEANAAGVADNFFKSPECIVHRRYITYLIQILYEIVKRGPSHHWNALNPLDSLLGLVLAGSEYEIILKIAQYVVRTVSQETLRHISEEKKQRIAKRSELAEFLSVLEGREISPINLCDTVYSFADTLSTKSPLLIRVLSPDQYVSHLSQLSMGPIIRSELDLFSSFSPNWWAQKLAKRDCPSEFIGLTLFQSIFLILIKKISDPDLLKKALQRLVDCVPAVLWNQSYCDKKSANTTVVNTPRRLLLGLCLRENGHVFFPLLNKILEKLPLEAYQDDIPDYLKGGCEVFCQTR